MNYLKKWMPLFDQVIVSGGNFLTVALCAHYLPLNEQGKLTYVIACYMALLLFNVSAIFQGASVRAPAENNKEKYLFSLAGIQVIFALEPGKYCYRPQLSPL